jgi:uncharacterized membrane protein YkvI
MNILYPILGYLLILAIGIPIIAWATYRPFVEERREVKSWWG